MVAGERQSDSDSPVTGGPVTGDVEPQAGHAQAPAEQPNLAVGQAVVGNGRISTARRVRMEGPRMPFSLGELETLDEALTFATRDTGLDFSIRLGDLGEDPRTEAERLVLSLGPKASRAVLIAVSPGQRVVEVVTGAEAARRLRDRDCSLAVMAMVADFKEGALGKGLIAGMRKLVDQAGSDPNTR